MIYSCTVENNDLAPMRLPAELVILISVEGLADPELARVLTQVCSWIRAIALSAAYATIPRVRNVGQLSRFPDHLRPFVRNVFIDDIPPTSGPRSVGIARQNSWLWCTATHLVIPSSYLDACSVAGMAACSGFTDSGPPPTCIKLTMFGFSFLQDYSPSIPYLLSNVTHLHLVDYFTPFYLAPRLIASMRSVKFVAFSSSSDSLSEIIGNAPPFMAHERLEMVVLVVKPPDDLARWIAEVQPILSQSKSLHLLPIMRSMDSAKRALRDILEHGRKDIWQLAKKARQALLEGDVGKLVHIRHVMLTFSSHIEMLMVSNCYSTSSVSDHVSVDHT
ncbi:hypothetical protein WOLCODRAFT_145795 [Wolfiporia cocos MD-104 SS10]|uniref:Uncharacterized protein n=1 Tax=Wolfiporia cocos (strain MD-104) TaxID=742152 RepID=A0A2H3JF93_WOLCO|nr:hypothetical protein WOLCODRAFT_145795 [Wolfiporia cocos MD-104 SS10]